MLNYETRRKTPTIMYGEIRRKPFPLIFVKIVDFTMEIWYNIIRTKSRKGLIIHGEML